MKKIDVIDGPNLNLLGQREPELYGTLTRAGIAEQLKAKAATLGGLELSFFQSNDEGAIINRIQAARGAMHGILLNPAAYGHTSLAIADAIRAVQPLFVVEVHLTNTKAREPLRHAAPVGAACHGRIEGFGLASYILGLQAISQLLV